MHPSLDDEAHGALHPASPGLAHVLPDLLHQRPSVSVNVGRVTRELRLAFGTGDAETSLSRALEDAAVAPSWWEGSNLRDGLYLDVLVDRCMRVTIGTWTPKIDRERLIRLLGLPPADPETRPFRIAILRELTADPMRRAAFERVYAKTYRIRTLLEGLDLVGRFDARVRRLHILESLRDLYEEMASQFAESTSGLHRMGRYAKHVLESEAFRNLQHLLDYEGHLGTVEVRLRIGADGQLRSARFTSSASMKTGGIPSIARHCEDGDRSSHFGSAATGSESRVYSMRGSIPCSSSSSATFPRCCNCSATKSSTSRHSRFATCASVTDSRPASPRSCPPTRPRFPTPRLCPPMLKSPWHLAVALGVRRS